MLSGMPESPALDLRSASLDDLRGRDLSAAVIARAKAPKPTWFVKRLEDDYIFAVEEREAWDLIYNRSTWKRQDFKFVGFSDGKTYKKIIDESIAGASKLEPEIAAARTEIEKYRRAEERLIIDEAVDMDGDPEDADNESNKKKVQRLRVIIDKLETKLEKLEKEYRSFTSEVVKTATDAEMKVALRNWTKKKTWPRAVNIHTPGVSGRERDRILGAMNQGGYG